MSDLETQIKIQICLAFHISFNDWDDSYQYDERHALLGSLLGLIRQNATL